MASRDDAISLAAWELREQIDQQHAKRIGEVLGCAVSILRREELPGGVSVPVFGVPMEFLATAEAYGLRAEGVR